MYLAGCMFNITDGEVFHLRLFSGASGAITGGRFDGFTDAVGSAPVSISGGTFPWRFTGRDGIELIGGEFMLDGQAYLDSEITITVNEQSSSVLTAILANGSVFIVSPLVPDELHGVSLTTVPLPPIDTTPIIVDDPDDAIPSGLRTGQMLTVRAGGELPEYFAAVNATIHLEGGQIHGGLELVETTLNVTDGLILQPMNIFRGSTMNFHGGLTQNATTFFDDAVLNLTGGSMGFTTIEDGAFCNMTAGLTRRRLEIAAGGVADISGGRFWRLFAPAGSDVELIGNEFLLNGNPVPGSMVSLTETDVLTGVLGDGRPFVVSPQNDWDTLEGVTLTKVSLPVASTDPIILDNASGPFDMGLRAGQSLILEKGGLIDTTVSIVDADIRVNGGRVFNYLELSRSQMTVVGGIISSSMRAYSGSTIEILGGRFGLGGFFIFDGAVVNVAGSDVDRQSVQAFPGGTYNLFGSDFAIDGQPITGLTPGQAFEIIDRNVTLTGILTDGEPISSFLHTVRGFNDYFDTEAVLTVTLVPPDLLGDMNCDGVVNTADIAPFALALTDPAGYAAEFPHCDINRGDIDQNAAVDGLDIQGFVEAVANP